MSECPSRFSLLQLASGDLPSDERRLLSEHVEHCLACREMLNEIESNAAVYNSREPEHLAKLRARLSVEEQQYPVRPLWMTFAPVLGGLVAAAAIILMVVPQLIEPEKTTESTDIRYKGTMAFEIVARRNGQQFRVKQDMELFANDALRFVVTIGSSGYLSVFSIDADNRISPFYPDSDPLANPDPMMLDRPGRHELPGSIILDQVVGNECFIAAFSEKTFDRDRLHKWVKQSSWYLQRRQPGEKETEPGLQLGVIWVKKTQ